MSDRISRGGAIALLAGVPIALATSAAAAAAADDSNGTKAKFRYVSVPGPKGQKCIGCTLFVSPAACTIVKGKISPNGYCIAFATKPA